ncbi:inositol transporter 4-like isoform X5 [Papaver somniferum]|uniref:inositol transporter 4-like isoform X5 n=1 Tax=Papaver somniferum TaxID=3469 RepID=UPI000E6FDB2F|nr:inositol transporter 4-like isoform X5 [Papaver somniferum]XP_026392846.1 inositol transporter 4-like isoform X5 [Papaver somniferum]
MRSLFISHALHSLLALEQCLLVILQANLVIMAIVGAMFGAAFGCWTNDSLGKKRSVLMADVVTFLATMLVAFSSVPSLVVDGTMIVGFGVGMVSMTSSLYILEASPPRLRSSFDCFSSLLIVVGQALSYRVNLFFTEEPRTWSCMIGVVWIPALVQFMLIWFLPESPKWFYREVIAVLVSCFLYSIFYR